MTVRTLQKSTRVLIAATVALLCTACVSAPEDVREQAVSALSCDASQVTVNRTRRHYLGDDYEAAGCGQKASYECERGYVVFIPVGIVECHKK